MEAEELILPSQGKLMDTSTVAQTASPSDEKKPRTSICCKTYCSRIRRVKSRGAVLVLVLNTLVDLSYYGTLGHVLQGLLIREVHPTGMISFIEIVIGNAIPLLLYPLAGWLADVHLGRYKTIRASLWLMWSGFVVFLLVFSIYYPNRHYDWAHVLAYYVTFPVVFIIINVGIAGFQANIIPFGLDQMPTASGAELSAFVHWYYWTRNIGAAVILTILLCTTTTEPIIIAESVVEVVCLSAALLCCYLLKKWMVIEPQSSNPFKTVYGVLKFAVKHKSPLNRSSLTYWEDELPSRVDLAKSKYGGPFSVESVENVKTFLRISVVLAALGGFIIVYYTNGSLFVQHLKNPRLTKACRLGGLLLSELNTLPILICLPIYEFLIYPFFQKYIPSTLKRIGAGMVFGILCIASLLTLDAYGHAHESTVDYQNNTGECFLINATVNSTVGDIDVNSGLITIPYILDAVAEMLVYISALELLCAQSPYNMQGMLIGAYYSMRGVFALFAGIFVLAFTLGFEANPYLSPPSCGTLYYAFTVVVAIVGLIIYICVARSYKWRRRDDLATLLNQQEFVEQYYGTMTQKQS